MKSINLTPYGKYVNVRPTCVHARDCICLANLNAKSDFKSHAIKLMCCVATMCNW